MFSYYGSKWTLAKHIASPLDDETVVEPFAGSAAFSLYWGVRRCHLYDLSPSICLLWDFLIGSTERDIRAIPDSFRSIEEVLALNDGAQLLVRFWVSKGRAEPSGSLSPWYFQYANDRDCKVWGPKVKARIIKQKPYICDWTITCASWEKVPEPGGKVLWYIDPPYSNTAGSRYPLSDVDFEKLSGWVKGLPGRVAVSEASGADWLPFQDLRATETTRGKRSGVTSREAIWRNFQFSHNAVNLPMHKDLTDYDKDEARA